MKMPGKGEKGFTLIELLIVIAILGVLAAIVVPNVGRFIGEGTAEAMDTEQATVQAAVQQMMITEGISNFDTAGIHTANTSDNRTKTMSDFPSETGDYKLYGASGGNYLNSEETSYYYTIDSSGTVTVYEEDYTP